LGDIDDPGDRGVAGRAGGGLDDGGRDRCGTIPGDDNPVCAEAVSRADQGTEVLGVFDPVEKKDEAAGKGRMTVCCNLLQTLVSKVPAEAEHALVGCRAGLAIEELAPEDFHLYSPGRCTLDNPLHILTPPTLGDDDLPDVATLAPENLRDGIDAVDDLHRKVTSDR
jgi:hypothetical protein